MLRSGGLGWPNLCSALILTTLFNVTFYNSIVKRGENGNEDLPFCLGNLRSTLVSIKGYYWMNAWVGWVGLARSMLSPNSNNTFNVTFYNSVIKRGEIGNEDFPFCLGNLRSNLVSIKGCCFC